MSIPSLCPLPSLFLFLPVVSLPSLFPGGVASIRFLHLCPLTLPLLDLNRTRLLSSTRFFLPFPLSIDLILFALRSLARAVPLSPAPLAYLDRLVDLCLDVPNLTSVPPDDQHTTRSGPRAANTQDFLCPSGLNKLFSIALSVETRRLCLLSGVQHLKL